MKARILLLITGTNLVLVGEPLEGHYKNHSLNIAVCRVAATLQLSTEPQPCHNFTPALADAPRETSERTTIARCEKQTLCIIHERCTSF